MAVFASGMGFASDPVAVTTPVAEVPAPVVAYELPPSPSLSVTVAANGEIKLPEIKPSSKPKIAKKNVLSKTLLSRSARSQMALLAEEPKSGTKFTFHFFDDEDYDFGSDDLDLHRSFSRPKVVDADDHDGSDELAVSDHARVRLFMARMKAVEAHRAAHGEERVASAGDADLPDNVKLRLFLARQQALRAHEKKFS